MASREQPSCRWILWLLAWSVIASALAVGGGQSRCGAQEPANDRPATDGDTPDSKAASGAESTEPAAKLPVPSPAARDQARALILKLYKDGFESHDSRQRGELAERLLREASETSDSSAARYELLVQGVEVAVSVADISLADRAIQQIGLQYDVDPAKMKRYVVSSLSTKARSRDEARQLVGYATSLVRELLARDEFDEIDSVVDAALIAARRAREAALVRELLELSRATRRIAVRCAEAQEAMAALQTTPQDTDANLVAGSYLCFAKGDFARGVPYLALGSDKELSDVAALELAQPESVEQRVRLADAWWEVALKKEGWDAEQTYPHAANWYLSALPELKGLTKTRVEARLAEYNQDKKAGAESNPRAGNLEELTRRRVMANKWKFVLKKNTYTGVRFGENGAYSLGNQLRSQFEWKVANDVVYLVPTIDQPLSTFQLQFRNDGTVAVRYTRDGKLLDEGFAVPE